MASNREISIRVEHTPGQLELLLGKLISNDIKYAVMMHGPAGVGKSSIVGQVARGNEIEMIDVRLSQLAPTDLRGLPVPDSELSISRWFPPEFLPRDPKSRGILFLDEINMAGPTMQGIAQQLILDRKVGSYVVPEGWFIWAAGNRKEDRATVFEMPAPLANRFLHYDVKADVESWKAWALDSGQVDEEVLAFVSYRPELLHKLEQRQPAWPSPRTWTMANTLYKAGFNIAPAVGDAAANEFQAYISVYKDLPNLDAIADGQGAQFRFPSSNPGAQYAVAIGLVTRMVDPKTIGNSLEWLAERAPSEWTQMSLADLTAKLTRQGQMSKLLAVMAQRPKLAGFMALYRDIMKS